MFRERPTRRSPLFAAGTLALLLSSCAELQTIREDVCGNGVVENDEVAHESCDGQDNCGAPGTTHACRFVCDPATKDCPEGYGCGIDGECRMPSGKFEKLSSFSTPTAIDLFVNDINADGCSEVFHTTLRGTTMTAFESHVAFGCTAAKQDISSTAPLGPGESLPPAPVLADASRDGLQDLLVPGRGRFGGGLFANLGTSGPGLAPLLYPSVKVQENTVKPLRVTYHGDDALLLFLGDLEDSPDEQGCMGGMGGAGGTGMGGMGMGGMGGGPPGGGGMGGGPPPGGGLGVAAVRSAEKKPVGIGGLPGTLATLAFAQAANLDSDPSCDEVAVGIAGEPRIHLLSICGANDIQLKELGALDLDSGAQIRSTNASLAIVDFDGDGHLDLVVDATDAKIHVGYGDGTGKFHSVPGSIDPADHTTAAVNPPSPEFADPHRFFVAGDFDASKAGAELVSLP